MYFLLQIQNEPYLHSRPYLHLSEHQHLSLKLLDFSSINEQETLHRKAIVVPTVYQRIAKFGLIQSA